MWTNILHKHSTEDTLYDPGLDPSGCLPQRNRRATHAGACATPLYIGVPGESSR